LTNTFELVASALLARSNLWSGFDLTETGFFSRAHESVQR
jgi:hypothetical protein